MARPQPLWSDAWWQAATSADLLDVLFPGDRVPRSARNRRTVRLLYCAAARQLNSDRPCAACDGALVVSERFADGQAFLYELTAARVAVKRHRYEQNRIDDPRTSCRGCLAVELACERHHRPPRFVKPWVVRDLFPDPSAPPVKVPKKWRTATVVAVARGSYDDHAFDRLPVLADALEDAGCDSEPLLTHLRGPGPHVRGCWALDAVLGL